MTTQNNEILNEALDFLRQEGLRITQQRTVILKYLIEKRNHPTAEMIFTDIKSECDGMSLATVYNTLELFVKNKLVIEIAAPDEKQHFDYFAHPHYHVICTNCGKIEDVFDYSFTAIETDAAKKTGYQISHSLMEVYGLCPDCQKLLNQAAPLH
ncbi:transcriptional repressor [Periweissella cryptocerci]|uniref:Transcriptional repressor n=1 Tax=Periweissella cryptocerci TaxID=2506420 RepID=A0A4V1AIU0_9LACO|nr:Fur family transcriptional regulator [Periweissella cryptocerci]QBO36675.1 transcriptional repressor [Periweissella cryptocerci]